MLSPPLQVMHSLYSPGRQKSKNPTHIRPRKCYNIPRKEGEEEHAGKENSGTLHRYHALCHLRAPSCRMRTPEPTTRSPARSVPWSISSSVPRSITRSLTGTAGACRTAVVICSGPDLCCGTEELKKRVNCSPVREKRFDNVLGKSPGNQTRDGILVRSVHGTKLF